MTYEQIYRMNIEDLINYWNRWCMSHERRELKVYTMSEWRRDIGDCHTANWFMDNVDFDNFNSWHEFVGWDGCDYVWRSSDDVFDLLDVYLLLDEE